MAQPKKEGSTVERASEQAQLSATLGVLCVSGGGVLLPGITARDAEDAEGEQRVELDRLLLKTLLLLVWVLIWFICENLWPLLALMAETVIGFVKL